MKSITSKYKTLCIKVLMNAATEEEAAALRTWTSQSESNQQEFEAFKETWELTGAYDFPLWTNVDAEWESFQALRRHASHHPHQKLTLMNKVKPNRLRLIYASRFAMAAAVILSLAVVLRNRLFTISSEPVIVTTANAELMTYYLPDGSSVILNSGSQVRHAPKFNNGQRYVYLKGEAFFNIEKNNKPFVVETDLATIKVLGTQFNVWSRHDETTVIVKRGLVEVGSKDDALPSIMLKKNFMSRILADTLPSVEQVENIDPHLAWMEGKLIFDKEHLGRVTEELERHYDIDIELSDASLYNRLFTGVFGHIPIELVLKTICDTLGLNFETINNGTIFLKSSLPAAVKPVEPLNEPLRAVVREFIKPQLKFNVNLPYPELARKLEEQGVVRMLLHISKEGHVEQAWIKESSGSGILDKATESYANSLVFEPARVNDHPVASWMIWSINYTLVDQQALRVDRP